jgi:hypothetical protein
MQQLFFLCNLRIYETRENAMWARPGAIWLRLVRRDYNCSTAVLSQLYLVISLITPSILIRREIG